MIKYCNFPKCWCQAYIRDNMIIMSLTDLIIVWFLLIFLLLQTKLVSVSDVTHNNNNILYDESIQLTCAGS